MSWGNEQNGLFLEPNVSGGYMPTYTHTPNQRRRALPHAHIGDPPLGLPPPLPPHQFPLQPSEYASAVPRAIPYQPVTGYVNDGQHPAFPQAHVQAPSLAHPPIQAHVLSHAHAPGHARAPSRAYAPSHTHAPSHTRAPSHTHAPSHSHAPSHAHIPSHTRAPYSPLPPPSVDSGFGGTEHPHLLPPVQSPGGWSFGGASSRATYEYGLPNGFERPSLPVPNPLARPSSTPRPQPDVGHYQARPSHAPVAHLPHVGQRKALLVGINYSNHRDHGLTLNWGVYDAQEMARFLREHLGFHPNNIRILTDDQPKNLPTKENILSGMRWLVKGAQQGDSLFFYFSGHATQIKDKDGDESDGFDECLCAVDYNYRKNPPKGIIVDDKIHDIMVKPLPQGCRLTAVLDCCNSGTLLDLPYIYDSHGVLKQNRPDVVKRKRSEADVISLSACKDGGKAYEVRGGGALREAFIMYMMRWGNQGTHVEVIQSLRAYMAQNELVQRPQLSSSHWIDTDQRFTITG